MSAHQLSHTDVVFLFERAHQKNESSLSDPQIKESLQNFLPKNFSIHREKSGKPIAKSAEGPCPFFSVSHSRNLLTLAISQDCIGVDLEFKKPRIQAHKIAERYFSKNEQDPEQFYFSWTAREAFTKALGLTIATGFRRIKLSHHKNYSIASGTKLPTHRIDFITLAEPLVMAVSRPKGTVRPINFFDHRKS